MSAASPLVGMQEHDGVVRLTLSNPRINALSPEFVAAIGAALESLAARDDLWVVHLRSDQSLFGAGGDLKFMNGVMASAAPGVAMRAYVKEIQRVLRVLETLPAVTVCELGGAAYGGGLEIALSCDFRVAAETALLGLPEVGLGLLPAAGGTQRLTRLVGRAFSRQVILLNTTFDAQTALRIGLVDAVHSPAALAAGAEAMVRTLRGKPREALLAGKACIARAFDPDGYGFDLEVSAIGQLVETAETRRRVGEFIAASAARRERKS
ncbi:MAG: enoyl-CoA hydratase/isomerase family protein [Nevskia sp.]|nr:enoyl-CoA hydratase/isomerase family protein [Nevskia sp.]